MAPSYAPVTVLDTSGLDEVSERYVVASEKYIDQRLMLAATDACLEVIRLAPDYLPIHLRMGEIYEREGRPEEALSKYQLLIDTYIARGESSAAIPVYFRLIELSPDTTNARARLADGLLECRSMPKSQPCQHEVRKAARHRQAARRAR